MTEQKEKGYQGIRATEAFGYENTKSDFKLLLRKMKNYVRLEGYQGPKGYFQITLPLMLMVVLMNQ